VFSPVCGGGWGGGGHGLIGLHRKAVFTEKWFTMPRNWQPGRGCSSRVPKTPDIRVSDAENKRYCHHRRRGSQTPMSSPHGTVCSLSSPVWPISLTRIQALGTGTMSVFRVPGVELEFRTYR
jgi:hypothetical protein